MDTFELASGAATNWNKTVGIRAGTLQGVQPDATIPPEMRDIEWHDAATAPPQRYLGVWLGGRDQVQAEFTRKVSAKLLDRINHNAKRRPATWQGRSAVLKTLCFSALQCITGSHHHRDGGAVRPLPTITTPLPTVTTVT